MDSIGANPVASTSLLACGFGIGIYPAYSCPETSAIRHAVPLPWKDDYQIVRHGRSCACPFAEVPVLSFRQATINEPSLSLSPIANLAGVSRIARSGRCSTSSEVERQRKGSEGSTLPWDCSRELRLRLKVRCFGSLGWMEDLPEAVSRRQGDGAEAEQWNSSVALFFFLLRTDVSRTRNNFSSRARESSFLGYGLVLDQTLTKKFIFFFLRLIGLEPYTRDCLLLAPISKGAYALHSLPLNDEAGSGRRDLNPQPQPWQGYALPLSYFRQLR
ncbi:hypothetical protein LIER_32586 [Lithospermum erythrorhizon]|uniref:Uncharacterized protein n=1 Tax=Lithospermum erythrorhizon TaxID=34254 RepID=A0AAV3RU88_LITER